MVPIGKKLTPDDHESLRNFSLQDIPVPDNNFYLDHHILLILDLSKI